MKFFLSAVLVVAFVNVFPVAVQSAVADDNVTKSENYVPNAEDWYKQAHALEKFWLMPEARGIPEGRFPTWRCNDGTLRTPENLNCSNTDKHSEWMKPFLSRTYIRMLSRQTFGYGALYNLTGNEEDLKLHEAGVQFLLDHAKDADGGFYTYLDEYDEGHPGQRQRTTQDLAYALIGLAMNAYLTHSQEAIDAVVDCQEYIYRTYYSKNQDLLTWVLDDFENDKTSQKELVAQLDQLNAYMLLTWRLVPEARRDRWTEAVQNTIRIINTHFYNRNQDVLLGCLDDRACNSSQKGWHRDFGHRSKTFWMELIAASGLGDNKLIRFTEQELLKTLKEAKQPDCDEWYESSNREDASWWVYAELDEAAMTMAMEGKIKYPQTVRTWLEHKTDRKNGEVSFGAKQHLWRSAYHSTEHALAGYILTQGYLAKQCKDVETCLSATETKLYFAPAPDADPSLSWTPYLFGGDIIRETPKNDDSRAVLVTFRNIRLPDTVHSPEM